MLMRDNERNKNLKLSLVDRVVQFFSPQAGLKRLAARGTIQALSGYNTGKSLRRYGSWNPSLELEDEVIQDQLNTIRERAMDSFRNNPIAHAAVKTVTHRVVGSGLSLQAKLNAEDLGITEDQAIELENIIEKEWALYSESRAVSTARNMNFNTMQRLAYMSYLKEGDVFAIRNYDNVGDSVYKTSWQLINSDRVSNPQFMANSSILTEGVEKSLTGRPIAYHIANKSINAYENTWQRIRALGTDGSRRVLHIYNMERAGQTRGWPYLTPALNHLKMLEKYDNAELMAAVIASMFTVFIKTEDGNADFASMTSASDYSSDADSDYKLGHGAMIQLANNESIEIANPNRPGNQFDAFQTSILRKVGAALQLPFELLIKHFTSSYSAARAALLDADVLFRNERELFVESFLQPVYNNFIREAILLGRLPYINPRQFDNDKLYQKSLQNVEWVGANYGQIDETKAVQAAQARIEAGLSTRKRETRALTGSDFDRDEMQRQKEEQIMQGRLSIQQQNIVQDNNNQDPGNNNQ